MMSVAVAAVTNVHRDFENRGEIAATATEVKKFLTLMSLHNRMGNVLDSLCLVQNTVRGNRNFFNDK